MASRRWSAYAPWRFLSPRLACWGEGSRLTACTRTRRCARRIFGTWAVRLHILPVSQTWRLAVCLGEAVALAAEEEGGGSGAEEGGLTDLAPATGLAGKGALLGGFGARHDCDGLNSQSQLVVLLARRLANTLVVLCRRASGVWDPVGCGQNQRRRAAGDGWRKGMERVGVGKIKGGPPPSRASRGSPARNWTQAMMCCA